MVEGKRQGSVDNAKVCRQVKSFIEEKLANEWAPILGQLSSKNAKILVGPISGTVEVNYHRHMVGRALSSACRVYGFEAKITRHIF